MIHRTWTAALLLAAGSPGCREKSVDEAWDLDEVRIVHACPSGARTASGLDDTMEVYSPLGVDRSRLALAATETLAIGRDVRVLEPHLEHDAIRYAFVSSLGDASIGANSMLGGLYVLGNALLVGPSVLITQYVKTVAPPVGPGAMLLGPGLLTGLDPAIEEFRWHLGFPEGADWPVHPSSTGNPDRLPPGHYGAVTIDPGASASLRSGTYTFRTLELRPGAGLLIDNTAGPVYLWSRQKLTWAGHVEEYALTGNILIGYAGDDVLDIAAPMVGTLVAPRSIVEIHATEEPHRGAIFARVVRVHDGAAIVHRPFGSVVQQPPKPPTTLCGRCAVLAAEVARSCCNEFKRHSAFDISQRDACVGESSRGAPWLASVCEVSALPRLSATRAALEECLLMVSASFSACERHEGYRVGTCAALGYPTIGPGDQPALGQFARHDASPALSP